MSNTTHEPPAVAVANDPHWAAKVAKMRGRKLMERTINLQDDAAHEALEAAKFEVIAARQAAAARLRDVAPATDSPEEAAVWLAAAVDEDARVVTSTEKLASAEAEVEASDVPFRLRALPADVWENLIGENPPTTAQAEKGLEYNHRTFAPVVLAACSVDPLTITQAAELIGGDVVNPETGHITTHSAVLSQGEASLLFTSCVTVNQGARATLGKG